MLNGKNILTRIRAADCPPAGAYATEIPSNRYVEGNLLSKSEYSQTKEEDNGRGDMGTSETGDFLKSANVYLEKIAGMASVKNWSKQLLKNVKDAEPLTQVGIGMGALFGAGKVKAGYDNMNTHKHHSTLEEKSLKTLQAINRNLNKAVVAPK